MTLKDARPPPLRSGGGRGFREFVYANRRDTTRWNLPICVQKKKKKEEMGEQVERGVDSTSGSRAPITITGKLLTRTHVRRSREPVRGRRTRRGRTLNR